MTSVANILSGERQLRRMGLIALLLLVAGCYASAPGSPPTPPLPATPTGPVVQVALLSPTSGELATFGRMMRNGAGMALEQANNRGGVRGRRLEWLTYDAPCDFDLARQAAQQAIADGIQFIIGPLCSEAALAVVEPVQAAGVVLISPTATHPLVTVDQRGQTRLTIFRAAYVDDWQARAAACFARQTLQANTAALLADPTDDYSRRLAATFARQFSTQSGQIVHQSTVAPGESDLSAALAASRKAGASVLYLPAPAEIANRAAAQLSGLNLSNRITLLGSDAWEADALDRRAVAGGYFTTHFVLADPRPIVQTWAEAYQADYAIEPNTLAALGYDAAGLLVEAMVQAGSFEPTMVAHTLEQITFVGVTGPVRFDRQHNPLKAVPVVRLGEGELEFVASIQVDPLTLACPGRPTAQ
ncbi:MAG: ABC transporter substrate-binding protein [Chloroflexota bacterium]